MYVINSGGAEVKLYKRGFKRSPVFSLCTDISYIYLQQR